MCRSGVVQGAVGIDMGHLQVRGKVAQGVLHVVGKEHGGEVPSIVGNVVQDQPVSGQELQVKVHVVAHHGVLLNELLQIVGDSAEKGRARHLVGGNPG